MPLIAFALILASAVMHATWNYLGKRRSPDPVFFLRANLAGAVFVAVPMLANAGVVARFPPDVWLMLAATGIMQAAYFVGLSGAYRTGDLSVAYPVARALPVLMVAGVGTVLGIGRPITPMAAFGMVVVALGCLFVPLPRLVDLRLKTYRTPAVAWAIAAALGTTGYSTIDDFALRRLRLVLNVGVADIRLPIAYSFWEAASCCLFLGAASIVWRRLGGAKRENGRTEWQDAALAGIGMYLGYTMVLFAMGFARNVSYTVAFRQMGIPIGALLGVVLLKEPAHLPKIAGTALIVIGLLLSVR